MEIVNGLWLGKITHLEELTLRSFSKYAEFHLWTYDEFDISIKNVIVRNGREILPDKDIFVYPAKMDLPFGGGTYVGFSEIFRYKVLYDKGGWWSDMDITCLKPLEDIKSEYFFREHGTLPLVGNIIKCPPKSELMRMCYEESIRVVNETTTDWHLAMNILAGHVNDLGLSQYIKKDFCNVDKLPVVKELVKLNSTIPESWHFIHWMNTIFDKYKFHSDSVFGKLLTEYNCRVCKTML